jgi:hypothetical protein
MSWELSPGVCYIEMQEWRCIGLRSTRVPCLPSERMHTRPVAC